MIEHQPQIIDVRTLSDEALLIVLGASKLGDGFPPDQMRAVGGEAWLRGLVIVRDAPTDQAGADQAGPSRTRSGRSGEERTG